jgi:hypothetical protein
VSYIFIFSVEQIYITKMSLNVTELDDLNDGVEDVGSIDEAGVFTASVKPEQKPLGSRVPQPRITTMAYKNRGSLANNVTPPPARKVTYDDILSSLNMQVVNGKLQITRNVVAENVKTNNFNPASAPQNVVPTKKIIQNQHQQQQQGLRQNNGFDQMRQQQQMFQQKQQMFQQQQQNPSVPIMSKEQYKQMVAANYLKALEQQQRIKNMKSTKMMFSNSSIGISPISGNNGGGNMNRLFRFGK